MKEKIESFLLSSDGRLIMLATLLVMSTVNFYFSSPSPALVLWSIALLTGTTGILARMAGCEYCASKNRSGCQLLGHSQ
jgi:hypothetical protein